MASPNKLPGPALIIKSEPGTSRGSSLRLPSFKPPRDLMLGGPLPNVDVRSSRKVYVPNLNVQRKKHLEDVPANKLEPSSRKGVIDLRGGRGRGGDRGGRKNSDLIQSTGSVFAEGIAKDARPKKDATYEGGGGGGGGRGGRRGGAGKVSKMISRMDAEVNQLSTDAASDCYTKIAHILEDCDFLDDPGICPDEDFKPRELISVAIKTEEPSLKKEPKVEPEVLVNGLKVKQEVLDVPTATVKSEDDGIITFPKLFRASSPKLILMKLPSGLMTPDNVAPDASRPSTSIASTQETVEKDPAQVCSLPEGRIGTMQLMKSGLVRLIIGDHVFMTELGSYTSMKQDLMVLNLNPNATGGDSINLGPIDAHLVSARVTLDSPYFNPQTTPSTMKLET